MALDFPGSPASGEVFGGWTWDGSKWVSGAPGGYLPIAGGTMTGALILAADPIVSLQAATKQYVDGRIVAAPGPPTSGALWWDSNAGQLYIYYNDGNSSQWVSATNGVTELLKRYNIGFSFIGGVLGTSQLLGLHKVSKDIIFSANFGAFAGHTSEAGATAAAAADVVLSVERALAASPNTFSQIGIITIAAGGVSATFATSGGVEVSVAQGDVLRVVGPPTADATLANVYVTLIAREA